MRVCSGNVRETCRSFVGREILLDGEEARTTEYADVPLDMQQQGQGTQAVSSTHTKHSKGNTQSTINHQKIEN